MQAGLAVSAPTEPRAAASCTVAEALAQAVAAAGVEFAFAFPGGGSNLAVIDALRRLGVDVVLTRSEEGGAFMAATYAELRGRPGVLLTGLGPGAASALNGAAHALLDRVPLLVVSDRYSAAEAATSRHQLLDQRRLLEPVTKWQADLEAADAGAVAARALEVAAEHPRGPVLLQLARDAASASTASVGTGERAEVAPRPDANAVGDVARLVEAAERPVLLVGLEARAAAMQDVLVGLSRRLDAPVLTTYKAKGAIPESDPLAAGILTGGKIERPLLERADLLLAVGLDPVELLPRPWPELAPLVALRAAPVDDPYLRPARSLAGSLRELVAAVTAAVREPRSAWRRAEIGEAKAAALESLRVRPSSPPAAWEVVNAVAAAADADAVVAVDAGAHMFAVTTFWQSLHAGRFLISNGLSTMGYAVPAAIAASLLDPGGQVIAFTGDGGFLLHANELETAVRTGARPTIVVLNDASLSLIRIKQQDAGLERRAVDFERSDFALLARSLGALGLRARTPEEVRAATAEGLAHDGPAVVDVALSGDEYGELVRRIRG